MKRIATAVLIALALSTPAIAQPAPRPDNNQMQALSKTVMELTGQKIDLLTQLFDAEARVRALEAATKQPSAVEAPARQ